MSQVHCPNCKHPINVDSLIQNELEVKIKSEYMLKLETMNRDFNEKQELLKKEKEIFDEKRKRENELFKEKLEEQLLLQKKTLEKTLKENLAKETAAADELKNQELKEKTEKIAELNGFKAENERLKREKETQEAEIKAKLEQKLSIQLKEQAEKLLKSHEENHDMKVKDLLKQLEDQKKLTDDMKRKQEQGSMQLQGESMELLIEEWLEHQFPYDNIEEIKKGQRGGDCIQHVHNNYGQICGTIYYESKRTKEFSLQWIEKFKGDIRERGCDIGVLVTQVLPNDMERMGQRNGIWICRFDEFKALSHVLRTQVIEVSKALSSQENKGDKMHLLYDYLTGNTFRMQVEAIVEGFTSLKNGLDNEKRAMQRLWKEREKQIEKVIENTVGMHGSVRGIAGNAVQLISSLELGGNEELEDDEN